MLRRFFITLPLAALAAAKSRLSRAPGWRDVSTPDELKDLGIFSLGDMGANAEDKFDLAGMTIWIDWRIGCQGVRIREPQVTACVLPSGEYWLCDAKRIQLAEGAWNYETLIRVVKRIESPHPGTRTVFFPDHYWRENLRAPFVASGDVGFNDDVVRDLVSEPVFDAQGRRPDRGGPKT